MDGCGFVHDKTFADPKATKEQVRAADREFQKCAQKVTLKDGVSDKLRSVASRIGFEGKIAAEKVGILRGGSFAAGGEGKGKHGAGFVGQELGSLGSKLKQVASIGKKVLKTHQKGRKFI